MRAEVYRLLGGAAACTPKTSGGSGLKLLQMLLYPLKQAFVKLRPLLVEVLLAAATGCVRGRGGRRRAGRPLRRGPAPGRGTDDR